MGSSKKHKKNKSERREKYEEYSDPANLQRGLKLILKVGPNSTPERNAEPPTNSPLMQEEKWPCDQENRAERHKKSKKKKKKKDREKKHKHHKEKRHRSERHQYCNESVEQLNDDCESQQLETASPKTVPNMAATTSLACMDPASSQDGFSFMDDENSQPLPENILFYAGITTDNSPSCRPVSKPILERKLDDIMLRNSPLSSSLQFSSLGIGRGSPTKLLTDLVIPSPSPSTTASMSCFTPKGLEGSKTPSSSSESGREPRSCVLKLKQQKSPLNKLLDHLLRILEKRDPHQFFAWPVTDDIAPGYSSIITKPMDFSTMRQKIDDNEYATLIEFTDDFKLMCDNAICYNHVDTVYHKAAKRLLQVGSKQLQPESLIRSLKPLSAYMRELTVKELGFELLASDFGSYGDQHGISDSADEETSIGADEPTQAQLELEQKRRTLRLKNEPKSRFKPYIDDLTSEEILANVQVAASIAKKRLSYKERAHKMGFLRQNNDGTTSLNLLIKDENDGPEKVISVGDLVGKLKAGSGQIQGLREDKRNDAQIVKPLNYGAFASFAPEFDSRFSNMSKEETQLVLRTYGDASATEYAESILQFTKDSEYASTLANGLLDILTGGEHGKAMSVLYDMQVQTYEQQEIEKCFQMENGAYENMCNALETTRVRIEQDYEKYKNTRIDFQRLRTLTDIGIDVTFLDTLEVDVKNFELTRRLQEHLSNNLNLIENLISKQHDRLSQSLPQHLAHVSQPEDKEMLLAHQITQQLSDLAKKLPPSAIVDAHSLRKAMGLSYVGLASPSLPSKRMPPMPELLGHPVAMPELTIPPDANIGNSRNSSATINMDIGDGNDGLAVSSCGVDLENELREFLESGPGCNATGTQDDSNIVAQLLMN